MAPVIALVLTLLRMLLAAVASALGPPVCAACDARLSGRAVFCPACAAGVEPVHEGSGAPQVSQAPEIVFFAGFGGPVAVALRRLKYEGRPDLAVPLGHLARRAARRAGLSADVVVPVPLHPRRLAERGYNQAALLAAEVAVELGAPLAARALVRVRNTPQQAQLGREGRVENVREAFRARAPRSLRGRRVVLVDDVATTGATLAACREALLAAGAASVTALVVAQA